MNIAGVEIGPGLPCRTVAELGNAHLSGGKKTVARACKLIRAATDAGADLVKFQLYTPLELIALRGAGPAPDPWGSRGWTVGELYEYARTPFEWMAELVAECRRVGTPWFTSVFGPDSLRCALEHNAPALKLAALDWGQRGLLDMVLATRLPLIHSARQPFAIMQIWEAAAELGIAQAELEALTLYCPPGYPQPEPRVKGVRSHRGYSYHGTDPLVPALAVTQGAQLIECHFQLETEPSELEPAVSLTPPQFAQMVDMIRRIEAAL